MFAEYIFEITCALAQCLHALALLDCSVLRFRRKRLLMSNFYRRKKHLLTARLENNVRSLYSSYRCIRMPTVLRRYWVRPCSKDWWENFVLKVWSDAQWIEFFRMPRATLFELVAIVTPYLQRQSTSMRQPIAVEKRVAISIWKLANPGNYKTTATQFGVGRSTVAVVFVEFCLALEKTLLRRTVCVGDAKKIISGFEKLGFPGCCGVIDGSHISICSPVRQGKDFINRKKYYSMLLQGTTDHTGRFINVEIGWSGRNHDAYVFSNSALFEAMEAGAFIPPNVTWTIGNTTYKPLLIADSAYPIKPWLMKPYGGSVEGKKAYFNYNLSRARNVVERAFGRLNMRWQCLCSRLNVAEENVASVISACVILHNICETKGEALHYEGELHNTIEVDNLGRQQENTNSSQTDAGNTMRDAIANFLWENRG